MSEYYTKKRKKNRILSATIIGTILATIIVTLFILLLNGKTTTTGSYPDNVSDESLTCTAENIDYPFFAYDNALKKEAKINILFSRDKLKSIALTYSLYYNDSASITASEAHNHATMNKSFATSGLKIADAYNAKYAKMENRMQMNLYTTASDFDNIAKKYFFIAEETPIPENIASFKRAYEAIGFKCESIKN